MFNIHIGPFNRFLEEIKSFFPCNLHMPEFIYRTLFTIYIKSIFVPPQISLFYKFWRVFRSMHMFMRHNEN
jgi:hypothetical protein